MQNKLLAKERKHLERIKEMRCAVCEASGGSEAHHIRQHSQYLCIPLCADCHRGSINGWHGQRRIWNVYKMDELDALNDTIRKILGG